jgi:acetyl esterase/lipase
MQYIDIRRLLRNFVLAIVTLGLAFYAWYTLSPWPSVLIIRHFFDQDAAKRNAALTKYVPPGIGAFYDRSYGSNYDEYMDVFFPLDSVSGGQVLPAVVWLHGGAFIAGNKSDVDEYLQILAARGYVAVAVGYTLAPGAKYPTPVVQANQALAFIEANAKTLHIDPERVVLAGDSAGAQIAAQVAEIVSSPTYAASMRMKPGIARKRLRGVILFCGVYDASLAKSDPKFRQFLSTVMWSYFGEKNLVHDRRLQEFSIYRYLTPEFPPAFVSAGNADPLEPQSRLMADAIAAEGVPVDAFFFTKQYRPALPHEYQFYLDLRAARKALNRISLFVGKVDRKRVRTKRAASPYKHG